ncbi:autotransporter outer membrane beta-barrel domain-containing protein [Chryseobacterium limigenitum]|uniref:Uncharacterized protein n=1 Tax=Chryseobacterium limigenitum TaxID=1612149 RepID=A0A1K2III3_9FLAO|nr:hypothetical protein [Chryseobacterium limigenitum]SFZ92048.1 hypothetical protein SAMN05216324_10391 [Chryseobacterium limigenitum]
MRKKFILLCLLATASMAYSQVGINTQNPQGMLHVDGGEDNPSTGIPNTAQQANDFTVTSAGRVGIGSIAPTSNLHIVNNGSATNIGGGEATNTGLLIENPIVNNSILSILRTTGTTGIKQAVMGINPNFNGNNGAFIISRTPGGSDFAMDLTTGNIGIATNIPTNTLDVAGSTRVRTLDVATGPTIVTPVYADTNGVLNKAVSSVYGTVINNTVNIASGATSTLITGIIDNAVYKAVVYVGNNCGRGGIADYYVSNVTLNNSFAIKGTDGLLNSDTADKAPTFTEVNRTTTSVAWTGVPNCAGGGNNTQFNYTLTMPSAGTINLTNNGNVSLDYRIVLTRIF